MGSWLRDYWDLPTALVVALSAATIFWVLTTKKNATSAVAWCLLVFLLPLMGPLLFVLFGYQHISRPLNRKRGHKREYQKRYAAAAETPTATEGLSPVCQGIAHLARQFGACTVTAGNHLSFYHEGRAAFDAMLAAIREARHHIHLEYFIFQPDELGQAFLDALADKAQQGVEVRLVYDAMGSHRLKPRWLNRLPCAGGKCSVFLPLSPLRRRIQINMRNHRKILVVDGQVAFTGGLNIGDEYLGKVPRFGYWRDTHLRVEGPAVADLQRVFFEDWDFASGEGLQGPAYFPPLRGDGPYAVQVIESGPDRDLKGIREVYFAAVLQARKRLWIASPYFVPDAGLLDALCLAAYLGVDVRLLCQFHPDKWIPLLAARYYWEDVLAAGVKVYQYTRGMLHSKVVIVDDEWASVGTANLDNRSLYLNFEVNCLLYSRSAVAELEAAYLRDLQTAVRLDRAAYARRPFVGRLLENASRLLSPVL
jgi:cardiolipin synthase